MTNVIVAPEGARGQVAGASPQVAPDEADAEAGVAEFTQQDYEKFMKGYRSQYEEISMWVNPEDIEGQHSCELMRSAYDAKLKPAPAHTTDQCGLNIHCMHWCKHR